MIALAVQRGFGLRNDPRPTLAHRLRSPASGVPSTDTPEGRIGPGLPPLALCTVSRKRHRKAPQTVHQRHQQLSSRLYRCAVVPFVLLVPESRAQIARGAKQTAS
jgi:hypothetical protein